jgi:hypothetical protein
MTLELTMHLLDLQSLQHIGLIDHNELITNLVNLDIQTITNSFGQDFLPDFFNSFDIFNGFDHLIAQAKPNGQFNQDVVGDMAKGWNNFIRSGQWASLLIGLVIGYMFRVFTSSG